MGANVVFVNLEDYLKEHDELIALRIKYQETKRQVKEEKENRKKIVHYILEKRVSSYRLEHSDFEDLINPTKWDFMFWDHAKELNELGITYEEMIEFIKIKHQEYMFSLKEDEEENND